MNSPSVYRERIYENYATRFQSANLTFDKTTATRWGKAYRHYFRGWLPMNKSARILEVACGSGKLLYFLRSLGYTNAVGVDVSPEQISIARQVANVVEGDATEFLERNAEQFDLVIGLDIVEHFRKDEALRFLDACYSSLKPGGRVVLQTLNADSPFGGSHLHGDFTHEVGFNPNSLSRLLSLVGFKSVTSRETGPVPLGYSVVSTGRWLLWNILRGAIAFWNLVEIGSVGDGVHTRIFLISAEK